MHSEEPAHHTASQPTHHEAPLSASEMAESSSPINILWIVVFLLLTGIIFGLLLYWIWVKSPLIGWVKVVSSLIVVALAAGVVYLIA